MAKKSTKKSGRPVGKITKVGIIATWVMGFKENETVKKAKRLTDEKITKFMKANFPGRDSAIFDNPAAVRYRYNTGALTKGDVPKTLSSRYDENGEPIQRASRIKKNVKKDKPIRTKVTPKAAKKTVKKATKPAAKAKAKARKKIKRVKAKA